MSPVRHLKINWSIKLKISRTYIYFFIFLFAWCVSSEAQDTNIVYLRRAETFNVINENIREFIGNVQFQQGNVFITCDRAIQMMKENRMELRGHVKIIQDTITLNAPHVIYNGRTKIADGDGGIMLNDRHSTITSDSGRYETEDKLAFFEHNVVVVDSESVLHSRRAMYNQKTTKADCYGDVKVTSTNGNTTIYGDTLYHYDDRRYTQIPSNPRLIQIDTTNGTIDTLIIISKLMEAFDDSIRHFIATDSVRLTSGKTAARGGKGTYYSKSEKIVLESSSLDKLGTSSFDRLWTSPIVWYEDNQMTGDTITIYLIKRQLHRVISIGNAFAISRSDSLTKVKFNQMNGRKLTMDFADKKIEKIIVERTATSLYYLYDEKKPNGVNKSSGNIITMLFTKGEIQTINISGGVQGDYYPENMIKGKEQDYNLAGFKWIEDRPHLRLIDKNIIQE